MDDIVFANLSVHSHPICALARLLTLLGQALKWQRQQGMLPPEGATFDVLAGGAARRLVEREAYVSVAGPVIKFGKKSHAECAAFSPDGALLATASDDWTARAAV